MFGKTIENYILYEDKEILVCRKPAGLAVQNARIGTMDLESGLKNYLAKNGQKQPPYLAVIHRLDQPVEGILVFGKNPGAAKELSRQITEHQVEKIYLAATFGEPPAYSGTLEDYLKKDGKTNTSSVVAPGTPGGKKARLSYEVLEETTDLFSGRKKWLVKIHLETGRHHQIRVQMAHGRMPLLGDRKYNTDLTVSAGNYGLALCAANLCFVHPVTGKTMRFQTVPETPGFEGFSVLKK